MSVSDPFTRLEMAYEDQCVAFDELSDGQGLAVCEDAAPVFISNSPVRLPNAS
jgi:hypothetical protein